MTSKIFALVVLAAPLPAFAGDSLHATCTGTAKITAGDTTKKEAKLVIQYDDERSGADKRKIRIKATFAGKTYNGTTISGEDRVPMKLAGGGKTLFDGTTTYEGDQLSLDGTYPLDKGTRLAATLTCAERK